MRIAGSRFNFLVASLAGTVVGMRVGRSCAVHGDNLYFRAVPTLHIKVPKMQNCGHFKEPVLDTLDTPSPLWPFRLEHLSEIYAHPSPHGGG